MQIHLCITKQRIVHKYKDGTEDSKWNIISTMKVNHEEAAWKSTRGTNSRVARSMQTEFALHNAHKSNIANVPLQFAAQETSPTEVKLNGSSKAGDGGIIGVEDVGDDGVFTL